MSLPLIENTDKEFWHRYVPLYLEEMSKLSDVKHVLEFGVFKGNSIRWLLEMFPYARIYGCDICPVQPEWPLSEAVRYYQVDQGNPAQLCKVFDSMGGLLDFVIEDGSHIPVHQKNCLVESIKHIRPGGIYILEDLHTSHPDHGLYNQQKDLKIPYIGPLHLLLAIEHIKAIKADLNVSIIKQLSQNSLFNSDDVQFIYDKIYEIKIHKRATLPKRCYRCGSYDIDYLTLHCHCGVNVYEIADSMTAVLKIGR